MSTHCAIIAPANDGFYGIYCHFDGYEDGVGLTLKTHYTDPEKVNKLIDLGDISSLGRTTDSPCKPQTFLDSELHEGTISYFRDRQEEWNEVKPKVGKTIKEIANQIDAGEFIYVFDGKNSWVNYTSEAENNS